MNKSILLSTLLHLFIIFTLLFSFNNFSKSGIVKTNLHIISLNEIRLIKKEDKSKKSIFKKEIKTETSSLAEKFDSKLEKKKFKSQQAYRTKLVSKTIFKYKTNKIQNQKKKLKEKKEKHKSKRKHILDKKSKIIQKKYTKKSSYKNRVQNSYKTKIIKHQLSSTNYFSINKISIFQAIQREKHYPYIAKRLNIQGIVSVSFKIDPNLNITNLKITGAHSILQKSAKETILRAVQYFPKPKNTINISFNMSYKLN